MYEDDGTPNEQFKRFLDEMGLTVNDEQREAMDGTYDPLDEKNWMTNHEFPVQTPLFPGILEEEEFYTMPTEVNQFHIDDAAPAREWFTAELGLWPMKPWTPDSFDEFFLRTLQIDPL